MKTQLYWILIGGEEKGPLTLDELVRESFAADTLIWEQGTPTWKPASEFEWYAELKNKSNAVIIQQEMPLDSSNKLFKELALPVALGFILVVFLFINTKYDMVNNNNESVT